MIPSKRVGSAVHQSGLQSIPKQMLQMQPASGEPKKSVDYIREIHATLAREFHDT